MERRHDTRSTDALTELRETADSLVENISAFQMALIKLETLGRHNYLLRTTLERFCRHAPQGSHLAAEIERVLHATSPKGD